jgi:hypothetical protein
MPLYNLLGTIARARYMKREAWSQAQLIKYLDPFQEIFNIPCWMEDTEQFRLILAEITKPDNAPEHWNIINRTI